MSCPDEFNKGPPRVAGIDRRVRLNDAVDWAPGVTALNLSSEAADDAGCERVIEPKRVPDREDTLAHHGVSARSDDERFHLPQRLWVVHLQHGDVLIVVEPNDCGVVRLLILHPAFIRQKRHLQLIRLVDDVVVGDDVPLVVPDDAAPRPLRLFREIQRERISAHGDIGDVHDARLGVIKQSHRLALAIRQPLRRLHRLVRAVSLGFARWHRQPHRGVPERDLRRDVRPIPPLRRRRVVVARVVSRRRRRRVARRRSSSSPRPPLAPSIRAASAPTAFSVTAHASDDARRRVPIVPRAPSSSNLASAPTTSSRASSRLARGVARFLARRRRARARARALGDALAPRARRSTRRGVAHRASRAPSVAHCRAVVTSRRASRRRSWRSARRAPRATDRARAHRAGVQVHQRARGRRSSRSRSSDTRAPPGFEFLLGPTPDRGRAATATTRATTTTRGRRTSGRATRRYARTTRGATTRGRGDRARGAERR